MTTGKHDPAEGVSVGKRGLERAGVGAGDAHRGPRQHREAEAPQLAAERPSLPSARVTTTGLIADASRCLHCARLALVRHQLARTPGEQLLRDAHAERLRLGVPPLGPHRAPPGVGCHRAHRRTP